MVSLRKRSSSSCAAAIGAQRDGIDPGRLVQHLPVHEGAVDAAEHGDDAGLELPGDLQQAFSLVDRRRGGRAAQHIGLQRNETLARLLVAEVVRHRADKAHVVAGARLEIALRQATQAGGQLPAISTPPEWPLGWISTMRRGVSSIDQCHRKTTHTLSKPMVIGQGLCLRCAVAELCRQRRSRRGTNGGRWAWPHCGRHRSRWTVARRRRRHRRGR